MKTSNYILTGFLVFFFGATLALHIDSKLYEDTYNNAEKERSNFLIAYSMSNLRDTESWNNFINETDKYYLNYPLSNTEYLIKESIKRVLNNYKNHNDTTALIKAKKWSETLLKRNTKDFHLHKLYATILFDLGYIEDAIKHQEFVFKSYLKRSPQKRKNNLKILNRYKNKLSYKKIEKGDKFIDVTLTDFEKKKVNLSNLIKNKVTLLSFWNIKDSISIKKNKSLLPIDNVYKNKGLQILGITDVYSVDDFKNNRFTPNELFISKKYVRKGSILK